MFSIFQKRKDSLQGARIGEDDLVIENSGSINLAVAPSAGQLIFNRDSPSTAREMLQQFVNNWLKGVKLP